MDGPVDLQYEGFYDRCLYHSNPDDPAWPDVTRVLGEPGRVIETDVETLNHLLVNISTYIETGYEDSPLLVTDLVCTIEALFEHHFPEMEEK